MAGSASVSNEPAARHRDSTTLSPTVGIASWASKHLVRAYSVPGTGFRLWEFSSEHDGHSPL